MQKIKTMFKKLKSLCSVIARPKAAAIFVLILLAIVAAGLIFYQQTHAVGITKYAGKEII